MNEQVKPVVWTNTQNSIRVRSFLRPSVSGSWRCQMNLKTSIHPPSFPFPAKIRQRRNSDRPRAGGQVGWFPVWVRRSGRSMTVGAAGHEKDTWAFPHEMHFPWATSHEIHGILKRYMIGRWGSETRSPGQAFPLPPPQFTAQVWWDGVDKISCHKPVTLQGSGKVGSSSQPPPLAKELVFQGHVFCLIHRHKGTAFLVLLGQLRELIQAKYLV